MNNKNNTYLLFISLVSAMEGLLLGKELKIENYE